MLAIGHDITERLQAEEALRRSEHHLANFFNQAPIGLVWMSASGVILRANQAQLDLLGCPAADYVGHSFLEFCLEESHGRELLERLAARETVRNLRMSRRRKDGAIVHVLVDANSSWNGNRVRIFLGFFARHHRSHPSGTGDSACQRAGTPAHRPGFARRAGPVAGGRGLPGRHGAAGSRRQIPPGSPATEPHLGSDQRGPGHDAQPGPRFASGGTRTERPHGGARKSGRPHAKTVSSPLPFPLSPAGPGPG